MKRGPCVYLYRLGLSLVGFAWSQGDGLQRMLCNLAHVSPALLILQGALGTQSCFICLLLYESTKLKARKKEVGAETEIDSSSLPLGIYLEGMMHFMTNLLMNIPSRQKERAG